MFYNCKETVNISGNLENRVKGCDIQYIVTSVP